MTFTILSPESGVNYTETNNVSAVIRAAFGNTHILFYGDAETEIERQLLMSGEALSADILKVGHHGSSTSSSDDFIYAVAPEYAVISCGKNNSYGHRQKPKANLLFYMSNLTVRNKCTVYHPYNYSANRSCSEYYCQPILLLP